MEARVAVLEQIAKQTSETLIRIETDLKTGFNKLRDDQRSDFKWLLGMIVGLGALGLTLGGTLLTVMAKGFKWF